MSGHGNTGKKSKKKHASQHQGAKGGPIRYDKLHRATADVSPNAQAVIEEPEPIDPSTAPEPVAKQRPAPAASPVSARVTAGVTGSRLTPAPTAVAIAPAGPTRQQRMLGRAFTNLTAIADAPAHETSDAAKKIFGGLCHTLPVLIRTNGLMQALAFIEDKIAGSAADRQRAFTLLRQEIAVLLEIAPASEVLKKVRDADVLTYQRYTRTILDAWIFYKRGAVAVLDVPATDAVNDDAA